VSGERVGDERIIVEREVNGVMMKLRLVTPIYVPCHFSPETAKRLLFCALLRAQPSARWRDGRS
jgi:hypothetical protein